MAKYTIEGKGNRTNIMEEIHKEILSTSISAKLESKEQTVFNDVVTELTVYERYSFTGKNRLSLTVLLVSYHDNVKLTLITTGGSTGVFFKINRIGERSFINKVIPIVEKLIKK